jgi:hypothetical protein
MYIHGNEYSNTTDDTVCFTSGTTTSIAHGNGRFGLGRGTQFATPFQGLIAHAAVWDKALMESERNAFLANGNPLAIANTSGNQHLLAYWAEDFFQDTDWYYEDKSGNDNHLLLEAAAVRTDGDAPTVDDPPSTGLAFTVAPTVTARTATSYTMGGELSAQGEMYAVAIPHDDTAPSVAQIVAGQNAAGTAASGAGSAATTVGSPHTFSFAVSGAAVANNPSHDIHYVGRKLE